MSPEFDARGYVNPSKLVTTQWVADHLGDPSVRIIESNEDALLYHSGHIPGAYEVDWTRDLNDPVRRDYLGAEAFQALLNRLGITPDTKVVFYGDRNNWWATYALWVFSLFGVENTHVMDGGRIKWEREGRPLTKDVPPMHTAEVGPQMRDDRFARAFRDEVLRHVEVQGKLIDVRSPAEFTGERLHMDGYPNEGALRGGHIPGARNIPWAQAVDPETGEFKPAEDLRALYEGQAGLTAEDDVIVYCRIGERSSHTWFVLKHLLGYPSVRNYDGSWTEWGNMVGVPIER